MAGWIWRERTGPQSWAERTLASAPQTPFPLIVFFALAILLLSYSYNSDTKTKIRLLLLDFQLYVFLILVLIVLYVYMTSGATTDQAVVVSWRRPQEWDWTPFWVAGVVVFLLVLVSYQSHLRTGWFGYVY